VVYLAPSGESEDARRCGRETNQGVNHSNPVARSPRWWSRRTGCPGESVGRIVQSMMRAKSSPTVLMFRSARAALACWLGACSPTRW